MENIAVPATSKMPVPIVVPPSRKVTVPVGTVVPVVGTTVVFRVTPCDVSTDVADVSSEVLVDAFAVFTVMAEEVEAESVLLPLYLAMIECAPGLRAVVLIEAFPLASSVAVPTVKEPSRKVIVPVGAVVPDWGVVAAVNVTLCSLLI